METNGSAICKLPIRSIPDIARKLSFHHLTPLLPAMTRKQGLRGMREVKLTLL